MSGPNCDVNLYSVYPETPNFAGVCSGNGQCINSTCVCNEGWTGLSDFINSDGFDCQINDIAIQVLWGFLILFCLFQQGKSASRIIQRYQDFKEFQAAQRERGKKRYIWENKGLVAALVHSFITFPGMVIYGIIRIVKIDERVGVTPIATVFFFVIKFAFYLSGYEFQPALLASILQGQSYGKARIDKLVQWNYRVNLILMILSMCTGAYAFIPFAAKTIESQQISMALYYGTMSGSLGIWAITFHYVEKQVDEVLSNSYSNSKNERTEAVRVRLVEMQQENKRQAIIQSTLYAFFLFFPWFWNKHDYFHPISWLAISLLGKKVAFTTIKRSGSSSRAGSKKGKSFEGSFEGSHTMKNGHGGSSMLVVQSEGDTDGDGGYV